MAVSKQWIYYSCLSLVVLLVIVSTINSIPLLRQHQSALSILPWSAPSHSNTQCASGNFAVEDTHLETFTYDRFNPEEDKATSLLGQAATLLGSNGGSSFVQIQEPNSAPLHYGVSMFHQLHCLESLKAALYNMPHEHNSSPNHKRQEEQENHLDHCFQYLQQGILCAADTTIEPSFVSTTATGGRIHLIDGNRVAHQCRKLDGLYKGIAESLESPIVLERKLKKGDKLDEILKESV